MFFKKLILILRRRLMLTPHIFLIKYKFSLLYQFFCMFKCLFIQFDCHSSNLLFQAQLRRILFSLLQTGNWATWWGVHRKPDGEPSPGFMHNASEVSLLVRQVGTTEHTNEVRLQLLQATLYKKTAHVFQRGLLDFTVQSIRHIRCFDKYLY